MTSARVLSAFRSRNGFEQTTTLACLAAEDVVELCALLVLLEPGVLGELVHHARRIPAEALDFPDAGQSLRAISDLATIQGPSK